MTHAPAAGERSAVRGYRWQYDHIAARVYDAIRDDDLVAVRLTDPSVGRVDDLVLIRRSSVEGYQFKSKSFSSYVTFNQLEREQRTRGGNPTESLLRSLGDGWLRLSDRYGIAKVHLVTTQLASISDHLLDGDDGRRASPDHLSAFLAHVLEPLREGAVAIDEVGDEWQPALARLRQATGIAPDQFGTFLTSLHLEFGAGSGLPLTPSVRRTDLIDLSAALFRTVSNARDVVDLDRDDVLALVGWTDRPRLHSHHEFPMDLDTYTPLGDAITELRGLLTRYSNGYVAVIGPPGAGKSTMLSQALSGIEDRVVRYYAYVPGSALAQTRLSARGFLHDVVVMLSESGLDSDTPHLPSIDVHTLRRQLADQLDSAGVDFATTGRRTIVVVDGLDHVDRDRPGSDGLLAELPNPEELPNGVVFLVGTRTLGPLHAYARQQIDDRRAIVDLQEHPLSPRAILSLCRRTSVTADLVPLIHQRIVDLSGGHPLALGYLLNRLRGIDPAEAEDALLSAPPYQGDIAAEYRALWDAFADDDGILEILAVCSRLRIGFTTRWLATWVEPSTVRRFERKLMYLFRPDHERWRFFHDSFRQFAADRTSLNEEGRVDPSRDAAAHTRVAAICAGSVDAEEKAEQLYHCYVAGLYDEVLALAQLKTFRDQYRMLRSAARIESDIEMALDVAAERAEVRTMIRLLLALVEVAERRSSLENIDMPGLLLAADLTSEAITYCYGENRSVPLAQAYGLSAKLGLAGNPAGRRIFDLVEHEGFDDPDRHVVGEEDDVAVAWTRAAVVFRPLTDILTAIRAVAAVRSEHDRHDRLAQGRRWRRYERMSEALIDAVGTMGNPDALATLDEALAEHISDLLPLRPTATDAGEDDGAVNGRIASLLDLRVSLLHLVLRNTSDANAAASYLERLLGMIRGMPLFHGTMLDAAELLVRHGLIEPSGRLLEATGYDQALTINDLTSSRDDGDLLQRRFRYWRLRCLLSPETDTPPTSAPPGNDTPAGNRVMANAPVPGDVEAMDLAERIDTAVRSLAWISATTVSNRRLPPAAAWTEIERCLQAYGIAPRRPNATLSLMTQSRAELMQLMVDVVVGYGNGLAEQLRSVLASRFADELDRWPLSLRLETAEQLHLAGLNAPWYEQCLLETEACAGREDAHTRLATTADLIVRYARDGDSDNAQRLAMRLVPLAFGVGYRKDDQFDQWVSLLGRALRQPEGEDLLQDAAWLARVLTAANPMTEGAPGSASEDLPASVAHAAPTAAVRVFEYLVREGTADHLNAMAALVGALVTLAAADGDENAVALAADFAADLIAPAANVGYPQLAEVVVTAAQSVLRAEGAADLAAAMATRTDAFALPTARAAWREGLGVPVQAGQPTETDGPPQGTGDYGGLKLVDGTQIARHIVSSRVGSVDDMIALRCAEDPDSRFAWNDLVDEQTLTGDEASSFAELFIDDSDRSADVLASLAHAAERCGDDETALRLAHIVLERSEGLSWASLHGGARLRAAAITVRLGTRSDLVAACQDLSRQVAGNQWLAVSLLPQLTSVAEALDPGVDAAAIWPEVRAYLEGICETLDLTEEDVFRDHGCRWWLRLASEDRRVAAVGATPADALAELVVGHLAHATWLVRDASVAIVARALWSGSKAVADALARFVQPETSDDILERVGRCLGAARTMPGYVPPDVLQPLERMLASHPSQAIRDLSGVHVSMPFRPLSPLYDLALPEPTEIPIGAEPAFLSPFEDCYRILAEGLGLDVGAILQVASRYASEALETLPAQDAVVSALMSTGMRLSYPAEKITAARAAFGRVLADVSDAQLLRDAPQAVHDLLRTVDLQLVDYAPVSRPPAIPPPPEAGFDQTVDRWRDELEARLEEYVDAAVGSYGMLVGGKAKLTVLNWDHLEEEFECGITVGAADAGDGQVFLRRRSLRLADLLRESAADLPVVGGPLVLENSAYAFHQIRSDWLAFRPDIAATLGWVSDVHNPGRWRTASGRVAVKTVWWVDGWWGRAGPAFDDTEAEGCVVLLTPEGVEDAIAVFGSLSSHFSLKRSVGGGEEAVTASQLVQR